MLTVGEILKNKRRERGLSLEDIYKQTRIRVEMLDDVENERWYKFSSKVYIVGILKKYSSVLGLDEMRVLAFFRRDYEKDEKISFKKKISNKYFTPLTKRIISLFLFLTSAAIFFYFLFQLFTYLSPPYLKILRPKVWIADKRGYIEIVGQVRPDSQVSVEGDIVRLDDKGIFRYKLPVVPSLHEVKIKVVGANGKVTLFRKKILNKRG